MSEVPLYAGDDRVWWSIPLDSGMDYTISSGRVFIKNMIPFRELKPFLQKLGFNALGKTAPMPWGEIVFMMNTHQD